MPRNSGQSLVNQFLVEVAKTRRGDLHMKHSILTKARFGLAGAAFFAAFGGLVSIGAVAIDSSPAAATPTTNYYTPLPTPLRIYDTRAASHIGVGTTLGPGGTDVVAIPSIPGTATAVVLNVTAVDATQPSYFTVFPTGDTNAIQSGGTNANFSSLNFVPGVTQPNLVVTPVGTSSSVTIFNHAGSADAVVDLQGYYSPTTTSVAGQFNPLPPARITDTRLGSNEPNSGTPIGPNGTLTVQVTGAGGVPALSDVSAVELNVTATNTTMSSYFTVYPTGSATLPLASDVNWNAGTTIPNRVIVPVGTNGQINIYNYVGTADAVVDVDGWFSSAGNTLPPGSYYTPLGSPARISDTRAGSNEPNSGTPLGTQGAETVQVEGAGSVPATGVTGAALNVTEATSTLPSYLTVYPASATRPTSSDLNFVPGDVIANGDLVGLSAGAINIFNWAGNTDVAVDVFGYFVPSAPNTIAIGCGSGTPPVASCTKAADGHTTTPINVVVTGPPSNNAVNADEVSLSVSPSSACGTLNETSAPTNSSGEVSAIYTSSVFAASCTITATEAATGQTTSTVIVQSSQPGYEIGMAANPSTVTGGTASTLEIEVSNGGSGASAAGAAITFSVSGACGGTPSATTADGNGFATASYTSLATSGSVCTITATETPGGKTASAAVTSS
jgi:hypothetical protein